MASTSPNKSILAPVGVTRAIYSAMLESNLAARLPNGTPILGLALAGDPLQAHYTRALLA